jgi:imidazolonepropionase
VAVLLPATSFCLRSAYAPARRFLDRGAAEEAVRAATAGGAAALQRPELGRLTVGSAGDLVVLEGETYADLAYHPGMDRVAAGGVGGAIVKGPGAAGPRRGATP